MDPLTLGVLAVVLLVASCGSDEEGKQGDPDRPMEGLQEDISFQSASSMNQVDFCDFGRFVSVPLKFFSDHPVDSGYDRFSGVSSIGEPLKNLRRTETQGSWGDTYPSYSNPLGSIWAVEGQLDMSK